MRNLMTLAPLLALFACGGADPVASCEDYSAALTACAEEAFGAMETTATGTTDAVGCEIYADLESDAADAQVEFFDCQTTAIEAGDCSTAEAYSATLTDAATSCVTAAE